jgi:CRP/FNR family transcriptional regulator, cyclic AMP receptor protein
MITPQPSPKPRLLFKDLRDAFRQPELKARTINIQKHRSVYCAGDEAEMIYVVVSGQIKTVMLSPEGKECLLTIYTAGDLFGESCLASVRARPETATAMEDTILKGIRHTAFLTYLATNSLHEHALQYLTDRLVERQEVITDFIAVNSEHRLGKALLHLGRKLGKKNPGNLRIEHRISHEELSQIVGTTRPRISQFIHKFRALGLIEVSTEHFLIIKEQQLTEYLTRTL